MKTEIILTGILKSNDLLLVVKRSEDDTFYPGAWEFPGGHLEQGELLNDGLKRELQEEIGFNKNFEPKIINYFDEIKEKNGICVHNIEIDFIIEVNKDEIKVILSNEHIDYKWVTKDSELLDDFIKRKLKNM